MHTESRNLKGSMGQKSRQQSPTEVGSTKQQYVTEKVFMHTESRSLKGSMGQKSRQKSPTEVGSTKQQYVTEKVLCTLSHAA